MVENGIDDNDRENRLVRSLVKNYDTLDLCLKTAYSVIIRFIVLPLLKKEPELEIFMSKFNKLKKVVKNRPERIEIKVRNEIKFEFRQLILDLLDQSHRIVDSSLLSENKRLTSPDGFVKAWSEFRLKYKKDVYKAAKRILKSQQMIVNEYLKKDVESVEIETFDDFFKETKYFSYLYWARFALESLIDTYGDMEDKDKYQYKKALKDFDFLENKILNYDLDTVYLRWQSVPAVFVSKSIAVKNPEILYDLYKELVKNYVMGNYWSCISLCRSLFEHILLKYYYGKDKDRDATLEDIISYCSCKYEFLRKKDLQKLRVGANTIIHEYNGEDLEDKVVFDFIRTVKFLIENIPTKKN